jgi:hypothetical protein
VQMKQFVVVVLGTAVFKVNLFPSWSLQIAGESVQWQKSGMFVGVISSLAEMGASKRKI